MPPPSRGRKGDCTHPHMSRILHPLSEYITSLDIHAACCWCSDWRVLRALLPANGPPTQYVCSEYGRDMNVSKCGHELILEVHGLYLSTTPSWSRPLQTLACSCTARAAPLLVWCTR